MLWRVLIVEGVVLGPMFAVYLLIIFYLFIFLIDDEGAEAIVMFRSG